MSIQIFGTGSFVIRFFESTWNCYGKMKEHAELELEEKPNIKSNKLRKEKMANYAQKIYGIIEKMHIDMYIS